MKLCAASVCRKRLGDSVLVALGLQRGWDPGQLSVETRGNRRLL
jgi:putative AlgH/UPF0301 family transcriptional regulator